MYNLVIEFVLLIFCLGFLYQYSKEISAYSLVFPVVSLSDFVIRVTWPQEMSLEMFSLSSSFFEYVLKKIW